MPINLKTQKKRLEATIRNAGPRYTAGLNVEVSIAKIFDGFGRTFAFYDTLKKYIAEFSSAIKSHEAQKAKDLLGESYFLTLVKECEKLLDTTTKIPNSGGKVQLPFDKIVTQSKKVKEIIDNGFNILRAKREEEQKKNPKPEKKTFEYDYYSEPFPEESDYLNNLVYKLNSLMYFSQNKQSRAANHKFIVLRGDAGSGKTHFLCDLIKVRLDAGTPSLIFLGQEFNNRDPWATILSLIGWTGTKTELLQQLEKTASQKRCRAFIVVDAVNEQRSKVNWSSLIDETKKYKSICVILSVRTGFEFIILPKKLRYKALDVIHEGFADREWDALTSFFEFYNLEPDLPLLFPDFTNPLFLKIFCETYQENGNTIQLRGHFGFTRVFERYVVKQGEKVLSEMGSMNMDAQNIIWRNTIKKIADYMVKNQTDRIPTKEIEIITKQVFPKSSKKFLGSLERNWLVLKNPVYADKSPYGLLGYDYTFPYQKFSDHLIVRHLLSDSAKIKDPKILFEKGGRLEYIFANTWQFRGLIEALSIQIPERFGGKELISLADKEFRKTILAKDSFLRSLIWRNAQEKGKNLRFFNRKKIFSIINKIIIKYHEEGNNDVLETILTVAAIPKHPLNARLLSVHLGKFSLAKKDSIWLPFLFHKHNNSSAVDRIIHWALKISVKTSYTDDSIELIGVALSWFLSSSDRYIRDTSTKALVNLLHRRLSVLLKILKHFEKCNDPYIQERLFAVAYGCALQSEDKKLYDLGLYVYKRIFASGKSPIDILLRDYARGTIERSMAVVHRISSEINIKKINPPYRSAWPENIPTLTYLKSRYKNKIYGSKGISGYVQIWHSLMYNNEGGIADFGNYVTNSAISNWSNIKLKRDGTAPKSPKQIWDEFLDGLNPSKKSLWEKYQEAERIIFWPIIKLIQRETKTPSEEEKNREIEAKKNAAEAKKKFEDSLSEIEKRNFKKASKYFNRGRMGSHRRGERLDEPSGGEIQRWMFRKVIQLGWTPELFYEFDSRINERGRSANKAERVGKKYQWIALHEILARLADNFAFKAGWSEYYTVYKGPWDLYRRDIDPSHDLALVERHPIGPRWWAKKKYQTWQKSISHSQWIKNDDATKFSDKFISVKDPNGDEWLSLEGYYKWREPQKPGKDSYSSNQEREVWLLQRAFIVRNKDANKLFSWAKDKNYIGGWLPEPNDFHKIFLREFPDGLAYIDGYWGGKTRWMKLNDEQREKTEFEVFITTEKYMNEVTTFDCSVNDTVHVYMPAKELIEGLKMKRSLTNPGDFVDSSGKIISQDPSVTNGGENCLLIRKKEFLSFLKQNKYSVVWAVMGEKIILSMDRGSGRLEFGGTFLMDEGGKIKGKKYKDFLAPRKKY